MNLVLIGFKASGKSTLGRALATHLKKDFCDMDSLIEDSYARDNKTRLTCREIFCKMGEKYFRGLEEMVLLTMQTRKKTVIASGGGVVCVQNATALLQSCGHVIFLDTSQEVLASRLELLQSPLFGRGEWRALLEQRRPMYREAAHTIFPVPADQPPAEIAQNLAGLLARSVPLPIRYQ